MKDLSLTAHNLRFSYDDKNIISNISFQIPSKSITAIVGRNGTGKSTILKLLAGLLTPQAGKILVGNQELNSLSSIEISKKIAYLGQRNSLAFDLTVNELIQLGVNVISAQGTTLSKKSISWVVKSYGLDELLNTRISLLSGGQRQNAFLAFTMLRKPSYLLLDEPTNHLDIANQIELLSNLRTMTRSKELTIVIILHDLNQALKFANNVILLKSNTEVWCGTPFDIIQPSTIEECMNVNSEILSGSDCAQINFLSNSHNFENLISN
jgi:iron complex transport system ATP-binding protein